MVSVRNDNQRSTEATLRRTRTLNELESSRQDERDRAVLVFGLLALVAIVVGSLVLMWLGGPRVEDPLPVPPTHIVQPTRTTSAGWAGNGNCPPECLAERGIIVPTSR